MYKNDEVCSGCAKHLQEKCKGDPQFTSFIKLALNHLQSPIGQERCGKIHLLIWKIVSGLLASKSLELNYLRSRLPDQIQFCGDLSRSSVPIKTIYLITAFSSQHRDLHAVNMMKKNMWADPKRIYPKLSNKCTLPTCQFLYMDYHQKGEITNSHWLWYRQSFEQPVPSETSQRFRW